MFEGGFHVGGDRASIQLNYNFPGVMILRTEDDCGEHVYRFPWSRLVGFDLMPKRSRSTPPKRGKPDLVVFPGGGRT